MFRPLHGLVTVVLDPKDKMTKGGLALPDNFGDIFITGTIRAVGPRAYGFTDDLATGDPDEVGGYLKPGVRVMIAQHGATNPRTGQQSIQAYPEIEDDGVKCSIMDQTEILGIIE